MPRSVCSARIRLCSRACSRRMWLCDMRRSALVADRYEVFAMILTSFSNPRLSSGRRFPNFLILAALCAGVPLLAPAADQARPIDPEKSRMTVHVDRGGVFGAFGHDHEIAAPIA